MSFREEFPTFPPDAYPAFPHPSFTDQSWKNDACPSMRSEALELEIWLDFPDPKDREFPETPRYSLHSIRADREEIEFEPVETDDWAEIVAAVETEARAQSFRLVAHAIESFDPHFSARQAGGNCTAWRLVMRDGCTLWLNDEASGLGTSPEELYFVSAYDRAGNLLEETEGKTLAEALERAREIRAKHEPAPPFTVSDLSPVFVAWVASQGLPHDGDANELLMGAELSPLQRNWLEAFVRLWNVQTLIDEVRT